MRPRGKAAERGSQPQLKNLLPVPTFHEKLLQQFRESAWPIKSMKTESSKPCAAYQRRQIQ